MAKKHILDGVRVLDLTNVLSGPFASLHLALLGAEVIKIENPKDGDLARKLGIVPEYNKRLMGTSFLAQNANKKSVSASTPRAPRARISSSAWSRTPTSSSRTSGPTSWSGSACRTGSSARSTRGSSTAPSPASGRPAPTR